MGAIAINVSEAVNNDDDDDDDDDRTPYYPPLMISRTTLDSNEEFRAAKKWGSSSTFFNQRSGSLGRVRLDVVTLFFGSFQSDDISQRYKNNWMNVGLNSEHNSFLKIT